MLRVRVLTLVRTMLWIGVCDSVFQFLTISTNFAQPLKRSGPTRHSQQSTYAKEWWIDYLGKREVRTNTDLNKFVNKI